MRTLQDHLISALRRHLAGCEWRTIAYWPDWLEQPIDPKRKFVPVL